MAKIAGQTRGPFVLVLGTSGAIVLGLLFSSRTRATDMPFGDPERTSLAESVTALEEAPREDLARGDPEQGETASPLLLPASPVSNGTLHSIERARNDLAMHATNSLHGELYINEVLDGMQQYASLLVDEHADFDYEDNDSVAYTLNGCPPGSDARMLVGLQPYTEEGRTYRYLQMEVNIPTSEPEYLDGALREGANISLSVSYDVDAPEKATRFALMLQRRVALGDSRAEGIDAYHGRFTSGAYYWNDLLAPEDEPSALTFGIIDGNPVSGEEFGGVPLMGDIDLDPQRLATLMDQFHQNLALIKGESQ